MWSNPQSPANLITFTEEILNGELQFLCSATSSIEILGLNKLKHIVFFLNILLIILEQLYSKHCCKWLFLCFDFLMEKGRPPTEEEKVENFIQNLCSKWHHPCLLYWNLIFSQIFQNQVVCLFANHFRFRLRFLFNQNCNGGTSLSRFNS